MKYKWRVKEYENGLGDIKFCVEVCVIPFIWILLKPHPLSPRKENKRGVYDTKEEAIQSMNDNRYITARDTWVRK